MLTRPFFQTQPHRTRRVSQAPKYKRYYHYLTICSQQEMQDLLNELISVSDLLG